MLVEEEKGYGEAKDTADDNKGINESFYRPGSGVISIYLPAQQNDIKLGFSSMALNNRNLHLYTRYGDCTTAPPSCSLVAFTINTTRNIVIETGLRTEVTCAAE